MPPSVETTTNHTLVPSGPPYWRDEGMKRARGLLLQRNFANNSLQITTQSGAKSSRDEIGPPPPRPDRYFQGPTTTELQPIELLVLERGRATSLQPPASRSPLTLSRTHRRRKEMLGEMKEKKKIFEMFIADLLLFF